MLESLGIAHIGLFVLAGWLLNLTPGPDVLYIISSALRGGFRAGAAATLGITAGCCVHIFAAALGVSALLATSSVAFAALKWMGAAYLLYVGVRLVFARPTSGVVPGLALQAEVLTSPPRADLGATFRRGFLTNALNPKVALFFLAFVPQFIAPGAPHQTLAFLLLGLVFNANALPVNLAYAALATWATRHVGVVQRGMRWLERIAGLVFITFGLRLALSHQSTS